MIEIDLVESNDVQQFNWFQRSTIYFAERIIIPFVEKISKHWLFAWIEDFADVDSPINNPYVDE